MVGTTNLSGVHIATGTGPEAEGKVRGVGPFWANPRNRDYRDSSEEPLSSVFSAASATGSSMT
jgi:hypothetical protein